MRTRGRILTSFYDEDLLGCAVTAKLLPLFRKHVLLSLNQTLHELYPYTYNGSLRKIREYTKILIILELYVLLLAITTRP